MDETITVAQLLDEWYLWKSGDLEPPTVVTTVSAIRFLKRDFGSMTVAAVKTRHVDRWFAEMKRRGYSPAYAKRLAGVLSAALSTAIRWELAETNPVASSEKPKAGKSRVQSPTADTVKRVLLYAATHDPVLFLFLRIDAITGARRSEILGLCRSDFDADLRTLTIRRVVVPGSAGVAILDRTKSDRGARTISIDEQTTALIEKSLASHESCWLFPGRDPSKPMYPTTVTHNVKKIGDALGVRLHPHALRHYVATTSLRSGVGLNVVAARLGDAPATVMKVYAHAIAADDAAVADAIAASID